MGSGTTDPTRNPAGENARRIRERTGALPFLGAELRGWCQGRWQQLRETDHRPSLAAEERCRR